MTALPAGQTLEELTRLVRESMNAFGLGDVLFAIRPLPFDFLNWDIHPHPPTLREEERNALDTVSRELREKHYLLLLINVPSQYAA
jgi:hypothetical protein